MLGTTRRNGPKRSPFGATKFYTVVVVQGKCQCILIELAAFRAQTYWNRWKSSSKEADVKKRFFLAVVIVLAFAASVACGDDSDTTAQPSVVTEPAPAVEPAPATASSGTAVTPTDPTTSIDPGVTVSGGITLADDCTVGDTLDDAATVIACNTQAMQQYESFSFDLTFNLLAAFPMEGAPEGAGEGLMRLSGGVLLPDKLQYTVSLGPAGQTIDINGVTIGADTYFQDPESMQWVKGTPPDDALLSVTPMVGLLYLATDVPTTLGEMVTLDGRDQGLRARH